MKLDLLGLAGAAIALSTLGLCPQNTASGAVILTSNYAVGQAAHGTDPTTYDTYSETSLPASHTLNAAQESNYNRLQINYNASGNNATFSQEISQGRDGSLYSYALHDSDMYFTVSANTTYTLSGYYHVDDPGTSSGYVAYYSQLVRADGVLPQSLSYSYQISDNTTDESFVLGGPGGDSVSQVSGSLTGELVAGGEYFWKTYIVFQGNKDEGNGAIARGNFTLTLGNGAAPVPEPAALAVWVVGALGMSFVGRRRLQTTSVS
jgi:hypothetical protein